MDSTSKRPINGLGVGLILAVLLFGIGGLFATSSAFNRIDQAQRAARAAQTSAEATRQLSAQADCARSIESGQQQVRDARDFLSIEVLRLTIALFFVAAEERSARMIELGSANDRLGEAQRAVDNLPEYADLVKGHCPKVR